MKLRIVAVLLFVLTIVALTAVFVPAEYFVLERKWSIEWGQQATRLKLKKYDLIGWPDELRSWLLQMDGAPGQEAAVLFILWGLENPGDFVLILDGIDSTQRSRVVNWLAGIIVDRKIEESFRSSFSGHTSPVVREILAEVDLSTDVVDN